MTHSISLARPLLVTLVVAIGIAAAWGFVVLWTIAIASQFGSALSSNEMLYVRVDGEPFLFRTSTTSVGQQETLTLDGDPTEVDQQLLLYPRYSHPVGSPMWGGSSDWSYRITSANDGGTPATYWYLVHDGRSSGRAYGVGYHASTRLIAGYFSRQGFSDQMPLRDDWFDIEGSAGLVSATTAVSSWEPQTSLDHKLTVVANRKLWMIDLRSRTVKAVADCSGPAALSQAWQLLDELPDSRPAQLSATGWIEQKWLLRDRERITLVDPDNGESRVYPLPEELRSAHFGVFALADGKLLIATTGASGLADSSPNSALITLDAEGKIVERKAFRLAQQTGASESEVAWASIVVAPMLVATAPMTYLMQYNLVRQGTADSLAEAFSHTISWLWPVILVVAVISLIVAVAAYRRQRRFALPHAGVWAAFAFLFGVPGWLAYRYHRAWPPVAACPACKQSTPRDRVACSDCGATFPPPPLKGIEVYA